MLYTPQHWWLLSTAGIFAAEIVEVNAWRCPFSSEAICFSAEASRAKFYFSGEIFKFHYNSIKIKD
jgi:hypothetical protein